MAHKGLREPHILLIGNPLKLVRNLAGVLTSAQLRRIQSAVEKEVGLLYQLGLEHYQFALSLDSHNWRQKVSRFYYGAYNAKRSMTLCHDGSFATDSSDHGKIDQLPDGFANAATYAIKLKALREDRNLADYSHLATEADLVVSLAEAADLVGNFLGDVKEFLIQKGADL